ncbi:MAG TPA: DUF3037 domain-containing protein [Candidatus Dormibacteraeota bacterium]|nr:DUF3037 domain-containing protein [Candidatus Dormibacteraeota bacterium]
MAERRKLEFFLLRYVPDAVKGEFVNFGLLALESGPEGAALVDVRFTKDWNRVQCLDPQVDLDVLEALQREIRQEIGQTRDRAALLRRMEDSFSNVIQVSPVMPALTEKVALAEVEDVARIFLQTAKLTRMREPAGRQKILETMRTAFEDAGVLRLLNAVPAEPYTKLGDPFEFDFGYRVGSEIKLFHAVSMRTSVDSAVMLAARYPKIAPVLEKVAGVVPLLTAVVEDGLDRSRNEVAFALEMMEESRIRVAGAGEMAGIAEVTRRELGA